MLTFICGVVGKYRCPVNKVLLNSFTADNTKYTLRYCIYKNTINTHKHHHTQYMCTYVHICVCISYKNTETTRWAWHTNSLRCDWNWVSSLQDAKKKKDKLPWNELSSEADGDYRGLSTRFSYSFFTPLGLTKIPDPMMFPEVSNRRVQKKRENNWDTESETYTESDREKYMMVCVCMCVCPRV